MPLMTIRFPEFEEALTDRRVRALWLHCAFGDDLRVSGVKAWLAQAGLRLGGRTGVSLVCTYASPEAELDVDLGAHPELTPASLQKLRSHVSPEAAELRWKPFVRKISAFEAEATDRRARMAVCLDPLWGVTGARRVAHPSAYYDRLMTRDRLASGQGLVELMLGVRARSAA